MKRSKRSHTPVRRVVLVEIDMPSGSWSAGELEAEWDALMPGRHPTVFGSIGPADVDGAFRKLRQLSRETDEEASWGDRVHSAHKALSFFREMFPTRFWEEFKIGEPVPRRGR